MQHIMPQAAGKSAQIIVQNPLFVSLYMVMREVEQGQCIRENSIVHTAVSQVQPFCTNKACSWVKSLSSTRLPVPAMEQEKFL